MAGRRSKDVVVGDGPLPWELPLALIASAQAFLDEAHERLAQRGHPGTRPVHGFTLQAVGRVATASEVAVRLGVTKQAAARNIELLERDGYVRRTADAADARRKVVTPTARGEDFLRESVKVFAEIQELWAARIGVRRLAELHEDLVVLGGRSRLDLSGWSS